MWRYLSHRRKMVVGGELKPKRKIRARRDLRPWTGFDIEDRRLLSEESLWGWCEDRVVE
jgi:hypothetical protein